MPRSMLPLRASPRQRVNAMIISADAFFGTRHDLLALLLETDGSTAQLKACAEELMEHGHEYTVKQLRQFRETSQAFPPEARKNCIWEWHCLTRHDPFLLAGV